MGKLQLSRTPALNVPLRFFFTAPLFGIAAALLLGVGGAEALSGRWRPEVLASVHLLTLGYLTMVMVGALHQVLPVVLGATLPTGWPAAGWVHAGLTLGAALLGLALLRPGGSVAMIAALGLLAASLLLFLASVAVRPMRTAAGSDTGRGVGFALFGLLTTLILGLLLGAGTVGEAPLSLDRRWTDLHALWGLVGWTGLLVVGMAYEVVPLFQHTPSYPRGMRVGLIGGLFAALCLWSLAFTSLRLGGGEAWRFVLWGSGLAVSGGLLSFAVTTLWLQHRRKKSESAVTLWYWRIGMLCLIAGAVGVPFALIGEGTAPWLEIGAAWVLVGFAVSVINGMLYKIVPFLLWLHLTIAFQAQGRGRREVPGVRTFLPEGPARLQFVLHLLGLALLCAALVQPGERLAEAAALVLGASFGLLGGNLLFALWRYRKKRDSRPSPAGGDPGGSKG